MREVVSLFEREIRGEDFDQYQEPPNAMKRMKGTDSSLLPLIGEGEQYINEEDNTLITKKDGKFYKSISEDNIIKLEEI